MGCGDPDVGSAPVVRVTPEQRAVEANAKAESTTKWLEGMAPADRPAAVRTPQVAEALRGASDPTLKARIAALGLSPTKP